MVTVAFFFLGDGLWITFGCRTPPSWYLTCKEYPLQSLVFIFLIVPSFAQSFVTTGAFEIMCNGEVLFSKLETGRFPNGQELIEMFKNVGVIHTSA